jgi:hypothetical protein
MIIGKSIAHEVIILYYTVSYVVHIRVLYQNYCRKMMIVDSGLCSGRHIVVSQSCVRI